MSGNEKLRPRRTRFSTVVLALVGLVAFLLVPLAPAHAASTISLSRSTVIGGESITVKGKLGQRKARQVILQKKAGRKWVKVSFGRSKRSGAFVFRYTPPKKSPSKTVVRVLAPKVKVGRKTYRRIITGRRIVRTVGQGATISMPSTTPRDEQFTITGTFTPARAGRRVVAQRPTESGSWVSVGSVVTQNSAGKVSIPMTLKVQGVYTFRVLALPSAGASAVASLPLTIEVTAPLSAPPVPTGLSATSGNSSAQLSWSPVAAPDLDGYNVYRRTSANEPWVKINTGLVTATNYQVSPLTNGLRFFFSVTAVDTDGNESDKSATVSADPSEPVDVTPPPAPTGVAATAGNASAQISWDSVVAGDLGGYNVYRGTSASGPWTKLAGPIAETAYSATSLTNGTTYYFAVSSIDTASPTPNESARVVSPAVTPAEAADETAPPVPSGVVATSGNASAQVSWNAVAAPDLAGYRVYRATTDTGPWVEATTTPATGTSYNVTGLENGTPYFFAVTSVDNSTNESEKAVTAASTTPMAGAQVWTAVSAGTSHSCARRSDATLWCWGYNGDGQLGSNADITSPEPTRVGNESSWTTVSAGDDSTCGVRTNGTLWCWGNNKYGQLGNATNSGTNIANPTPLQVAGTTWDSVSVGYRFACATRADKSLWCWGLNTSGQLGSAAGVDTLDPNPTPGQVGSASNWSSVSTGTDHACAVNESEKLWCWGGNTSGQLGRTANALSNTTPVQLGTADWSSVSAGDYHTCGVQTGGTIWCWGSNTFGELGKTANDNANDTPSQVSGTGWSQVSAGGDQTCAVKAAGTAWCWGRNQSGQLGKSANETANPNPAQVGSETTWTEISAGFQHTAALTSTGNILAWGFNEFGQTGDPLTVGTTPHPIPVLVPVP